MKQTLSLVLSFCLMASTMMGQSLSHDLVGSAGSYNASNNYRLHSAVGEAVVSYTAVNQRQYHIGFLQVQAKEPNGPDPAGATCADVDKIAVIDAEHGFEWSALQARDAFRLTVYHRNGHVLYDADYDPARIYYGEDLEPHVYLYVLTDASGEPCIKSAVTVKK